MLLPWKTCMTATMVPSILVLCFLSISSGASNISSRDLVEDVLKRNSIYVRPVLDAKTPVTVAFGLELIQIVSIDNRDQILKTKAWVRQRWINEYQKWNPSKWNGIKKIHVNPDEIWVPDVVLYNNGDDGFGGGTEFYKTNIELNYEGKNLWLAPATFISTCSIDIQYFPFDQQSCKLQFGSWTHDASGINLTSYETPMITSQYVNSTEWTIAETKETVNSIIYNCCPQSFIVITFEIVLKRKPLFYVFNVILPCVMLVVTILFGFFLPPESGERISLTITILLAVAVFLELVSATLPKNSDQVPVLGTFFMTMMAESVVSLITTCIILVIHYQTSVSGTPMPLWLKKTSTTLSNYLNVSKVKKHKNKYKYKNSFPVELKQRKKESHELKTIDTINESFDLREHDDGCISKEIQTFKQLRKRTFSDTTISSSLVMDDILKELKVITKSINDNKENEKYHDDWILLGRVLDRIFFIIFFLTTLIACTVILIPAYFAHRS